MMETCVLSPALSDLQALQSGVHSSLASRQVQEELSAAPAVAVLQEQGVDVALDPEEAQLPPVGPP